MENAVVVLDLERVPFLVLRACVILSINNRLIIITDSAPCIRFIRGFPGRLCIPTINTFSYGIIIIIHFRYIHVFVVLFCF